MKRYIAILTALVMLLCLMPPAPADGPHVHSWQEKSRVEPTCTTAGKAVYTCYCGARKTETLPALGHEFSIKVYTGYADCTHYGVFYWVCERCGAHSPTGNDKPLGHDWDEGVVTKAPTATEDGIKTYTCQRDPSHTKTEAIPALGRHAALELAIDVHEMFKHNTGYISIEDGSYDETRVNVSHALTNTGNIELKAGGAYWYNDDKSSVYDSNEIKLICPEETKYADVDYVIDSIFHPSGEDWKSYYTHTIDTPDDPVNAGYVTISVYYYAYDAETPEHPFMCESNVCTFTIWFPREGSLGEPSGLGVMKTELSSPANGEYYELGEAIDYIITLTNESGSDIYDVAVYDSLAGLEPIAKAESLPAGETKQFAYSTVVTEDEIDKATAVNGAAVTFDYAYGVSATPRFSNLVCSKAGGADTPENVSGYFDKSRLGAVPEHSEAEEAQANEQWFEAARVWNAEADKLYLALWEAGDDAAKAALMQERAMFYSWLEAVYDEMSADAVSFRQIRTQTLYAQLCSLAGYAPDALLNPDAEEVTQNIEYIARALRLKCESLGELVRGLQ
ncbi:MAG: hypothetical protein IKX84_07470 [Clostridia bacterium]|nr:hypothetical protein [Clostridia bacterium]